MSDMTWFTVLSTVGAALAIALGVMFPALAMGRAIGSALDALAPVPLLLLHIIEALVQAYIFGMLAVIYVAGAMQSHQLRKQA